ncbi:MAG: hypothetical protein NC548_36180 [Lachnospiraceae bacterium]|nr:hypothetical protein [Lachnospiraceae bacterium]
MFGISLIKTSKLQHLYSEASSLAIENVNLNKELAHRDATIKELESSLEGEQALSGFLAVEFNSQQRQNEYLKRVIAGFQLGKRTSLRKKKH